VRGGDKKKNWRNSGVPLPVVSQYPRRPKSYSLEEKKTRANVVGEKAEGGGKKKKKKTKDVMKKERV